MKETLYFRTTVLPGGRIEIVDPALSDGSNVDVVVHASPGEARRSVLDILVEAPGHRLFKTGGEVDAHIRDEREAWDR